MDSKAVKTLIGVRGMLLIAVYNQLIYKGVSII